MNGFDRIIIEFFNGFSNRSQTIDTAVYLLTERPLLKGVVVFSVLWVIWFARTREEAVAEKRKTILATFAGVIVALFLGKVIALSLPFRVRPMDNPMLHLLIPYGCPDGRSSGWNSAFPSDHAILFVGLVTGIYLLSRRAGILSFLYVLLFILVPRIYLGYHYPTDLLGGAFLGVGCVLLANVPLIKNRSMEPLLNYSRRSPGVFYGLLFLFSYQAATLWDDTRTIGGFVSQVYEIVARNYF
jgi:undecaprenyl-diphosphatase